MFNKIKFFFNIKKTKPKDSPSDFEKVTIEVFNKIYKIKLGNREIGVSYLEKADPPLGIVFGEIHFSSKDCDYEYLLSYCKRKKILIEDYPEDNYFQTLESIDSLKVYNVNGIKIKSVGNQLSILKNESYEISVQGIPYPFYEEEFPNHVQKYNDRFK